MFCAAIPAAATVGAKLNADQTHKEESRSPHPHEQPLPLSWPVPASSED